MGDLSPPRQAPQATSPSDRNARLNKGPEPADSARALVVPGGLLHANGLRGHHLRDLPSW